MFAHCTAPAIAVAEAYSLAEGNSLRDALGPAIREHSKK
jgi:hypothetical protein